MNPSANKDAALSLVNKGLRIFPCNRERKPIEEGWKQPPHITPLTITATWKAENLPALPMGANGLIVIDADRHNEAADGVAAFTQLCAAHHIDLQSTLVVSTPNNGFHFYFKTQTAFGNSEGSLPDGINVRGVGGYVIAPGARLSDGRPYRIVQGSWDTVAALPEPLAALLREKHPSAPSTRVQGVLSPPATNRERSYAVTALEDDCGKVRAAMEGTRNHTLNVAAHSLGTMDGWICERETCDALLKAAIDCGLSEAEARKTIQSGYEAGKAKPRERLTDWTDEELAELEPMIGSGIEACKRKHAEPSQPKAKVTRALELQRGDEIAAQSVDWLWDGFLPKGMLTLLAGAGGTGKSTIAFNLAATISNGGLWPDGSRCNVAGNVLIWSGEDDPNIVIAPRLMAAGANATRYYIVKGTTDEHGESCPFDPATDMDGLQQVAERIGGVSLLIIDPIVSAVTGDMHKANDVRRSLQPVVRFAEKSGCAVLGITHFAKNTTGKNSADRVLGSQAFAALARMVLAAAKEEESDRRVFTRAKSNISLDTGGFSYSIEAGTLNGTIKTTRVVWGEALEGSARAILAEVEGEAIDEGKSKRGQAKAFLLEMLRNGPVPSRELQEHAREGNGISVDTLRRAQTELGIVARKLAMSGGWVWELPSRHAL